MGVPHDSNTRIRNPCRAVCCAKRDLRALRKLATRHSKSSPASNAPWLKAMQRGLRSLRREALAVQDKHVRSRQDRKRCISSKGHHVRSCGTGKDVCIKPRADAPADGLVMELGFDDGAESWEYWVQDDEDSGASFCLARGWKLVARFSSAEPGCRCRHVGGYFLAINPATSQALITGYASHCWPWCEHYPD